MALYDLVVDELADMFDEWKENEAHPNKCSGCYHPESFYRGKQAGLCDTLEHLFGKESWEIEDDLQNAKLKKRSR